MTGRKTCETCQAWENYQEQEDHVPGGWCRLNPKMEHKHKEEWCMQHIPIEVERDNDNGEKATGCDHCFIKMGDFIGGCLKCCIRYEDRNKTPPAE